MSWCIVFLDFVDILYFLSLGSVSTCDGEWKKYGRVKTDTDRTFGGYSGKHTVPEKYSIF